MGKGKIFGTKKKKITLIVCAAAVLALIAAAAVFMLFFADNGTYRDIKFISFSGDVTVTDRSKKEVRPSADTRFSDSFSVRTGADGKGRLLIDSDKYISIGGNSYVLFGGLEEGSKVTSLSVTGSGAGAAVDLTRPLSDGEEFILRTPNVAASVKGTFFKVNVRYDEDGETFTDIFTYGGSVVCSRIMPDGETVGEEVAIDAGYKATVRMDDIVTVFEYDDRVVPIDISAVPDEDIVDMLISSAEGHKLFVPTEMIMSEITQRGIDISDARSYITGEPVSTAALSGIIPQSAESTAAVTTAAEETVPFVTTSTPETTTVTTVSETSAEETVTELVTSLTETSIIPETTAAISYQYTAQETRKPVPVTSRAETTTRVSLLTTPLTNVTEETSAIADDTTVLPVTSRNGDIDPAETGIVLPDIDEPVTATAPEAAYTATSDTTAAFTEYTSAVAETETTEDTGQSEPAEEVGQIQDTVTAETTVSAEDPGTTAQTEDPAETGIVLIEPAETFAAAYPSSEEPEDAETAPIHDGIPIDEENFPDEVYREYITDRYDTAPADGYLSGKEMTGAALLDLSDPDKDVTYRYVVDGVTVRFTLHPTAAVTIGGNTFAAVSPDIDGRPAPPAQDTDPNAGVPRMPERLTAEGISTEVWLGQGAVYVLAVVGIVLFRVLNAKLSRKDRLNANVADISDETSDVTEDITPPTDTEFVTKPVDYADVLLDRLRESEDDTE